MFRRAAALFLVLHGLVHALGFTVAALARVLVVAARQGAALRLVVR